MYVVTARTLGNRREVLGTTPDYDRAIAFMDQVSQVFRTKYPSAPLKSCTYNGFPAYRSGGMLLYIAISLHRPDLASGDPI